MHFFLQTIILASASLVSAAVADLTQPQQAEISRAHRHILNPTIDAAIKSILKDYKSPGGVGVAVVQKSEQGRWTVEAKGYGIAKVDGTKVTSDTLFAIGSNSKLFNVLATGLLISNETLSTPILWDTRIASVVPEWGLMDPVASSESTIQDVMSHRTGLPRHDSINFPTDTVPGTIGRLRYLKPSAGFREVFQYCNHMYTLLSYLPPLLTGIPFETYVSNFIIEPLGMRSTTYSFARAAKSGNLADGMARDGANLTEDVFGLGRVRALPYWAPNTRETGLATSGEGGVISNANDMAIWLQTLLNEGRHPTTNEIVIPSEIIAQVARGLTVAAPVASFPELSPLVYGGGQIRGSYRGFEFIEHGGSTPGFNSQLTRIPDRNFGVAVMSNDASFGTQIVETIKFRIIDEALKVKAIGWTARFKAVISAAVESFTVPTPRPENTILPSFPFDTLVGNYWDPGYGSLDFCLVSSGWESLASESCHELMKEIPVVLPDTINPQIPTLLTRYERVGGLSHLSLAHFEGNLFNLSALSSISTANSSDKPFWVSTTTDPSFLAEFSRDGDLGVGFRGIWGAGDGVDSLQGATVKERAEVWFQKVDETF
ncbi:beta-lactamase/transpeptidase-like protein [Mycena crocata]|nr:beta-lactamase/transpeptidase-like protein [Mycena crocata]